MFFGGGLPEDAAPHIRRRSARDQNFAPHCAPTLQINEIGRKPARTVAELAKAPVSTKKTRPTIMERAVEGKLCSELVPNFSEMWADLRRVRARGRKSASNGSHFACGGAGQVLSLPAARAHVCCRAYHERAARLLLALSIAFSAILPFAASPLALRALALPN